MEKTNSTNKVQLEKGFLQIATGKEENDIVNALIKAQLSGTSYQVCLLVIRKTWGYKKEEDWIALSQFMDITSRGKSAIVSSINELVRKNILVRKSGRGIKSLYQFNKNFDSWKILVRKNILVRKSAPTSTEKRTQLVRKSDIRTTKETITKETITKEKEFFKKQEYLINEETLMSDYKNKVFDKYNANFADVKRKAEELYDYCQAKGKRYRNYRAFLRKAIAKDFGYRYKN